MSIGINLETSNENSPTGIRNEGRKSRRFDNDPLSLSRDNQKQMQSRQLTARGKSHQARLPLDRTKRSRGFLLDVPVPLCALAHSLTRQAVCIRVNCISIDPVFISICREFMCELSGKTRGIASSRREKEQRRQ